MLTIERMAMFVDKHIVIQINGQSYGSTSSLLMVSFVFTKSPMPNNIPGSTAST